MSDPLRDRVFRRLALAYSVNELGNWLGDVALAIVVFDRTGSPLATAGLFLAARFAPALAAPLLVARVEPVGGRRALVAVYLAEAAAFAALAALVATAAPVSWLVALAALDGALALAARALLRAATAARLPEPARLRAANAILNGGMTLAAVAGPAAAGVLVATAGATSALAADAASFALVAALLPAGLVLGGARAGGAGGGLARLRAGAAYLRAAPRLGRLLCAQALALVFFTAVLPVEVVFAKATLGAGDAGYGALLASWGGGMMVGAALFARAGRLPLERLLVASTLAIGGAYGLTAAAPTLALACAAAVLGGAGNGVQWVAFVTALQTATAPAMQARVMSLMEAVAAAAPGVGFALGGLVAAAASPRAAFAVAAAGAMVAAAALALPARARRRAAQATAEWGASAGRSSPGGASSA
jgi:MFS family permease